MHRTTRITSVFALFAAFALAAFTASAPGTGLDTIKRSFSVQPGGMLLVDVDLGDVIVESSGGDMVYVELQRMVGADAEEEAKSILSRHEWTIEQDGNDVIVESRYDFGNGDRWLRRNRKDRMFRLKVVVRVPSRYNVDFQTGVGKVEIADLTGSVEGGTGAGSMEIGEIDGSVELRSGSGNIDIAGVRGTARVTSGAGNVTIGFVNGELRANTGAGDIEARIVEQPSADSRAETGAGNVTIFLADDVSVDVEARATVGSADCDFGLKVSGKWMSKSFEGAINGGGPALTLRSGVGNVSLLRD